MVNFKRPSHGVVVAYLALFVAMTGTATAATGGTFILGKGNSTTTTTTLSNSKGVPLSLNSRSGSAPLKVGSSTKVSNLNVDKLDGLDSTQFQRALSGSCNFGIASLTAAGYKTCATGDATTLDGLDSTLFLKVGDPLTVGPRGLQGDQGPAGPQGDKGDQGIPGPPAIAFESSRTGSGCAIFGNDYPGSKKFPYEGTVKFSGSATIHTGPAYEYSTGPASYSVRFRDYSFGSLGGISANTDYVVPISYEGPVSVGDQLVVASTAFYSTCDWSITGSYTSLDLLL
jgi:hypothetical protein